MQTEGSNGWFVPVFALFLAAFAVCTAEMIVAGVLPSLARDLEVDIATAGLLITGYAIGVALIGPALALTTGGVSRRLLLMVLMAVFVVGNVLCAIATSCSVPGCWSLPATACSSASPWLSPPGWLPKARRAPPFRWLSPG